MRLRAAFDEFVKSAEYAENLDANIWDFAIELETLRRLDLSNNDLRWLVAAGFIEYALETTAPLDTRRSFDQPGRLTFCPQSCFVLTPKGQAAGSAVLAGGRRQWVEESPVISNEPRSSADAHCIRPRWDRDRQELLMGTVVVKRFRVPATSQEAILAAFEEESWPPRIDDPLPPRLDQSPKRRLQQVIKSLNRNRRQPILRFVGDGSGQGVLWEYCPLHRNGYSDGIGD
ncbi:MAG: hypothetical protein DWQ37_11200 [Planctomycetota bacterium]|nr:MAG: hypothetical protein DWQ37_11200 [Planctomycetota bacterium]